MPHLICGIDSQMFLNRLPQLLTGHASVHRQSGGICKALDLQVPLPGRSNPHESNVQCCASNDRPDLSPGSAGGSAGGSAWHVSFFRFLESCGVPSSTFVHLKHPSSPSSTHPLFAGLYTPVSTTPPILGRPSRGSRSIGSLDPPFRAPLGRAPLRRATPRCAPRGDSDRCPHGGSPRGRKRWWSPDGEGGGTCDMA